MAPGVRDVEITLLNHSPDRRCLLAVAIERQTFDRWQREGARLGVFVIDYLASRGVSPNPDDRVPSLRGERRKRKKAIRQPTRKAG